MNDEIPSVELKPTSENTPVPGGGRWCWSDALCNWVALDAQEASASVNAPDVSAPINATTDAETLNPLE